MIAVYKGNYYNVSPLYKQPIRIWCYDQVEGFNRKIKDSGLNVYEKFIELSEIEEIFDVGFSALWHERWCGFDISFETNRIEVYSNSPSFAEEHSMEEIERFAYKLIVPIDSISEFKIVYMDCNGKTTREEKISLEELKVLWKRFYTDLMPH